jgi:hypothetical protein
VLILFRLENKEYIKIYSLGDAADIALNPLTVVSLPTRQELGGLMTFFWSPAKYQFSIFILTPYTWIKCHPNNLDHCKYPKEISESCAVLISLTNCHGGFQFCFRMAAVPPMARRDTQRYTQAILVSSGLTD